MVIFKAFEMYAIASAGINPWYASKYLGCGQPEYLAWKLLVKRKPPEVCAASRPCSFLGEGCLFTSIGSCLFRNRISISAHHCSLAASLAPEVAHFVCEYDTLPFSFAASSIMLANLAASSHKEFNVFFGFVTSLCDYLGARVSAASQADFREKSSAKTLLTTHISLTAFANLCLRLRQILANSQMFFVLVRKLEKVWQGKLRSPLALPSVPTASCSLPPSYLSDVFQDTAVALYRKACLSYPSKKATGPDLWEVGLLGALPDHLILFSLFASASLNGVAAGPLGTSPSWL